MRFFRRDIPVADIEVAVDFLVAVLVLVFAGIWAVKEFMSTPPYVDPERFPIRGIDVSSHNGMMNLDAAAKDGVEFVFIKASEGATFRDPNFRLNYTKARHAGLMTGAYHFFRFDVDGVSQAVNFLRAIGPRRLELGVAIDVESHGNPKGVPPDTIARRLTQMADYLNLLGRRVIFYTNRDGYFDYLQQNVPGAPLWICNFSGAPVNAEWTFWQYDHHGKVDGINGDVDMNAFVGSRAEWSNFLDGAVWPYDQPVR